MKLAVFYIESSKEDWALTALEVYSEKIKRFCEFEIVKIKSPSVPRESKDYKVAEEAKLILAKLKSEDFLILLDERGKTLDSIGFSQVMSRQEELPRKTVFLIGGAFGVADEIKQRAQSTLTLSPMVMNHHVALSVLMEQIYRAFTIIKKIPYHNS